jgi:hypothetical protein
VLIAATSARGDRDVAAKRADADERALARGWRARHPDVEPSCRPSPDPAARLVANLDDTPGDERVIADLTFGTAMFAATGALLGVQEPPGCAEGDERQLQLSARQLLAGHHAQLMVRTRAPRRCGAGAINVVRVLERRGGALVEILSADDDALDRLIDHGGDVDRCALETQVETTIAALRPGAALIQLEGRYRRLDQDGRAAPWRPVRNTCQIEANPDGNFVRLEPRPGDDCWPYDRDP